MSTIGFIKRGLDFAHKALADARNGSDEQLHFVPPNGSHSIAWCLWHTTRVEDLIINARILKQPMIWNGEWAERTGLPAEGFGREVPSRTGTESVGEAISLHMLGHFNGHRGEINTLRGMQGMPTVMAAQGTH